MYISSVGQKNIDSSHGDIEDEIQPVHELKILPDQLYKDTVGGISDAFYGIEISMKIYARIKYVWMAYNKLL